MSRIRSVTITPIAFADPPLLNSWGVHEPLALRTIVQLELDDGTIGVGETSGELPLLEAMRAAAPALVGVRVDEPDGLLSAVEASGASARLTDPVAAGKLLSPFEVAALDAHGKLEGVPVAELLGGRVRERVDFTGYLFAKWGAHPGQATDRWGEAMTPEGLVAQARVLVDEYGFRSLKLKGGVFPPAIELSMMRALAAAFPGFPLRMDPNGAWSVPSTIAIAAELESTLDYLEDPVLGVDGMAEVRRAVRLPLATNMVAISFPTLEEAVAADAIDIVLGDHHYWGGLRATRELGRRCGELGLGVAMHSNSHLGISLAAMTQVAAAMPELSVACDTHYPWNAAEDIVETNAHFQNGSLAVSTAPGLGVEVRPDRLERLHRQYLESGRTGRDDTAYARTVDPSYDPTLPRF